MFQKYKELIWTLKLILSLTLLSAKFQTPESSAIDRCFCELQGSVDDCNCSITFLESYNNEKIFPIFKSLILKDYFRFFKVNLNRECPFWVDDSQCAIRDCHVKGCGIKEIPPGLREDDPTYIEHQKAKYSRNQEITHNPECVDENHGGLGNLDTFISQDQKETMLNWMIYDDKQDNFCQIDDENSHDATFVDLIKNPERYTGYAGASAQRIWHSVYKENCFNEHKSKYGINLHKADLDQCLEKRIFYRMVSGLHTSISIHLCREYLLKDQTNMAFGVSKWGPNVTEFIRRFDPNFEPDGPRRLKNLFFTYLVELRALAKVADYLKDEEFFTGDGESDRDTKLAVQQLLEHAKNFPNQFDEQRLFQGDPVESAKLKFQFKQHFRNISRIMDCVGCDKCKLWGKLQVTGMGTALKILFSDLTTAQTDQSKFHLTRMELVALFNAFGRLSTSVNSISTFRDLMKNTSL